MHHIIFTANQSYETAILIKDAAMDKQELELQYLNKTSLCPSSVIAFSLEYKNNKAPVKLIKEHMANVLKAVDSLGVTTLFVCDGSYFKVLAGQKKAEPHYGYVFDCVIKGFEHIKVILSANYKGLYYNPLIQEKIDTSLECLNNHKTGLHIDPGVGIIHSEYYPESYDDIKLALERLHTYPEITADIEAFSLRHFHAGIGTCAFAIDEHNGFAFACDYSPVDITAGYTDALTGHKLYGLYQRNLPIRKLLLNFFMSYKGNITWHNANYDIKVLIYNLFMNEDHFDQLGLVAGLNVMTRNFNDTKIIAYTAINSTARNSLSLKDLSQSFAGNYANSDIKDIRRIPLPELLQYNLVDCLATWYVKKKFTPIMIADQQQDVYETILRPSVKMILQMELTGMPMDPKAVVRADIKLTTILQNLNDKFKTNPIIQAFELQLQKEEWTKKNLLLKVKVKPLSDFDNVKYNPNSNKQTGKLLHEFLQLPIIDRTPTKEASVGNKTLVKVMAATKDPKHLEILQSLMGIGEVSIILNTFVKAFKEKGVVKLDKMLWLHGHWNIGGTASGRLSSSDPNMQNLPSTGTIYANDIKQCFKAPSGWLMIGADFTSLEDKISALTTKDPNKLKVYIDGYDGHCLRAYTYFGEQMTGIDPSSVSSINSIKTLFPELRQDSKAPTFLLTYGGTHHGLVQNVGLDIIAAKQIEDQYHVLYKVSDDWVKDKLEQATRDGYITVAFGLRVRTPILARTILGLKSTPYDAAAEGRTAGNALGQSYGLLNNRAGIEFQERILTSKHVLSIKPISQIHDSLYFLVRDNYETVKWFNDNLIECMEWQNLPELVHPIVKLGGEVEIYHPTWADKISIPNAANYNDIQKAIRKAA